MKNIKPVYRIFLLALLAVSIYLSFNINGKNYKGVLHHDALGYYMYLPHTCIYHNFDILQHEDTSGYSPILTTGKIFDKYTYGTAVMMLPFFLLAHTATYITGMPPDGFGKIYDMGLMVAASFYLVFGMFFLIRAFSKWFNPWTVVLTILAIYGGTNLYFYTVKEPAYSHVYSFFLFSAFIYLVPGYIEKPTWKRTFWIALIFGWIFLIRATNGVVILYLLLYDVYSWNDIKQRVLWVWQHFLKLCLFPVAAFLWFIPQLIYWHFVLGKWQVYAYRHEGFIYWRQPKVFHVLFSVQNGMLIYAPIILLSFIGLGIAIYRKKFSGLAILSIIAISTYVFASWWCWWYGGSFGHRGYIEFFSFLAIPMAYMVSIILKQKPIVRYGCILVLLFCIVYTMQLSYAYSWPWEGPTWNWLSYGHVVGKAFGVLR